MAYLNVRERRLETTIAYVGATANLAFLHDGADVEDGALLSFAWAPTERFDDCDVMVKVVASRAPEQLEAMLADVDGVVVAAGEEDALVEVRARAASRPVVVQEAGVVETLEAALASVIAAMKARTTPPAPVVDPNPLLAALREVLRETVREHMAEVERGVTERIAAATAAAVAEAVGPLRTELASLKNTLTVSARESARALNAQGQAIDAHTQRIGELATTMTQLGRLEAVEHGARDLAVQLSDLETRLRDDLAARSKAEREQVTSSAAGLRRAIEGVATDVKKSDRGTDIVAAISTLSKKTDAHEVATLREIRARAADVSDAVQAGHAGTGDVLARTTEIHAGLTELLDELKKRKKWF